MIRFNLLLVCLFDNQVATVWPRNRTLDEKQVVLDVDLVQAKISDGNFARTVVTCHPLPTKRTTWPRTHTCTTGVTMALLNTVCRSLTGEVVTLHNTGETATFADPADVDASDFFERTNVDILTNGNPTDVPANFADELFRLTLSLGSHRLAPEPHP